MRKVDKMQKRGKHISKYFERPEGTQEDVAEMDGLRNCACSFLQHEPLSMVENMLKRIENSKKKIDEKGSE